ncbi:MAG TPA: diguanylate cyclase, partial [Candidatus Polarisedimenticolia bacterium]|nr:diguanylate cyclase [Candidatus Polarisedimenticolia bacterium]
RLAERVRKSTESFDFPEVHGEEPVSITVSAGVATFPINDRIRSPEQLVAAADTALYKAKAAGRNRTHVDERSLAGLV